MDAADPSSATGATLGYPCAFGGMNGNFGSMFFLEPISRSVAASMCLVDSALG
jgi:hypothetical protein